MADFSHPRATISLPIPQSWEFLCFDLSFCSPFKSFLFPFFSVYHQSFYSAPGMFCDFSFLLDYGYR